MALAKVSCFSCCCWIDRGATVMGCEMVWDVLSPMSSPEVSGYGGIGSGRSDDGRDGFNDECVHSGGKTKSRVDVCMHRALAEGGGLKLGFEDENPEINLGLESPSSTPCGNSILKA